MKRAGRFPFAWKRPALGEKGGRATAFLNNISKTAISSRIENSGEIVQNSEDVPIRSHRYRDSDYRRKTLKFARGWN